VFRTHSATDKVTVARVTSARSDPRTQTTCAFCVDVSGLLTSDEFWIDDGANEIKGFVGSIVETLSSGRVGDMDGDEEFTTVGSMLGMSETAEGTVDGIIDGVSEGWSEGMSEGLDVVVGAGEVVSNSEGAADTLTEGTSDGTSECVGSHDGLRLGSELGD